MARYFTLNIIICMLCFSMVYAQEQIDSDYYDPSFSSLLRTVEKYHLDPNTPFWKHFRAGEYNYALGELRYVLRYFPNHPTALMLMESIAKIRKMPDVVIPHYERALTLYPQYARTYAQYGGFLINIGRIDEGITKLKRSIEIDPQFALGHALLARAYWRQGNWELSHDFAQRAKELGYRGELLDGLHEHNPAQGKLRKD